MKYIAHRIEGTEREQTIKEHLEGTAKLARDFAASFGYGDWGYCCGMLHDIGKYSEAFQKRIRENGKKVDHATAGAQLCAHMPGFYPMLSYCIAGHHAGLPDTGNSCDDSHAGTMCGRMKKRIEDYQEYVREIEIPEITQPLFRVKCKERGEYIYGMFIRMLYSCLVDADFLDTEAFMSQGSIARSPGEKMEELLKKMKIFTAKWMQNPEEETVNGHRTAILRNCFDMGVHEKGLFRLTVPTGGGKTVASLAFALQHAVANKMDRIIYVIPYTSIIEQNAEVFRNILGTDNVLENHSNVNYEEGEELQEMQLAAENWDKPVVVTTNIQFFESFYSNKSSKCRKLHNVANSIIVFDEAQMLPNDYLKPCVAVIEELVTRYCCSAVLCTATQPALQSFFSKEINATELCPEIEKQFEFFKRTTIQDIGVVEKDNLVEILRNEVQALCILNTKKKVREIYQELEGEGVYHLSTYMYPLHRRRVINEIKQRLSRNENCIVISTSLVEAGVDLDFKSVYRELAGIDSLIQAAGRCNREGKKPLEESRVYVFKFDDEKIVPGQSQQIEAAKYVMETETDVTSRQAIKRYFETLYHYRGDSLDKKDIMGQFGKGNYPFATVSKQFKLIEENTKSIFIAKEEAAELLLQEIRKKGMTRQLMRKAGKYMISVREREFEEMSAMGMLIPVVAEMKEDFFVLRDSGMYTWEMGIEMERTIIM